jgi:hypothetical protein
MANERRLKKRKQILLEALERGINTPGGLARAVYGAPPTNKKTRLMAARLRFFSVGPIYSSRGRPKKLED